MGHTDLRESYLGPVGVDLRKASQPEPTYVFTHVLTRDVAYASLLNQVKKRLHDAIAQVLKSRYPEWLDEQGHLLQHHFSLAEHWRKSVQYGWQAVKKSPRCRDIGSPNVITWHRCSSVKAT